MAKLTLNKCPEADSRGVLCKKVFLEISQNSQENTCARVSFLIKLQTSGLRPATLLKKETLAQLFSCEFCEISNNNFLQSTSGRLLLYFWVLPNTESIFSVFCEKFLNFRYHYFSDHLGLDIIDTFFQNWEELLKQWNKSLIHIPEADIGGVL